MNTLYTIEVIIQAFSKLKWNTTTDNNGGRTAYAITGGNKETNELWVLAVIENSSAPKHEHLGREGTYGEQIWTISGQLFDIVADDPTKSIDEGESIILPPGSIHQPSAKWWFGFYHQPGGSKLVE